MKRFSGILVCLCVFLLSCSRLPEQKDGVILPEDTLSFNGVILQEGDAPPSIESLEQEFRKSAELKLARPEALDRQVKRWVEIFTTKERDRFQKYLDRSQKYKDIVQSILEENELPREFFYLALIESGFNTHAQSHARAVGIWQFIRGTAKRYGLVLNSYVDERRDPIRSTEAAAKYLRDLYRVFQSWDLAMAAYNSGEMRVLQGIFSGKSREFMELCEKKVLPRETRNYVPKFYAALLIGENSEEFGFTTFEGPAIENFEAVELPSPIHLKTVSKKLNISLKKLKELNPHLRKGVSPPEEGTYEVWVPNEKVELAKSSNAYFKQRVLSHRKLASFSRGVSRHFYRVRRGDTLSEISNRFHVSIGYLKKLNRLRGSGLLIGQKLRLSSKGYHYKRHRVRRGESLWLIAKRYKTSIAVLKRENRIRGNRIHPGKILSVPRGGARQIYIVKSGDTLSEIATRYGVSLGSLKRANRRRGSQIYRGEELFIP